MRPGEARTTERVRWFTVALLGVGMVIAQLHRVDLQPVSHPGRPRARSVRHPHPDARRVSGLEPVVTPAGMRYIRTEFEEERRGLAVSLYIVGTKIGPALSFPLATMLVSEFGWRAMFLAP